MSKQQPRDEERIDELEATVAELEEVIQNQSESFNTMLNARTGSLNEQTEDHEQRLSDVESTVEDLRDEVTELKLRLSEHDDADYQDLTLDDKIGRVREHAFRKAQSAGGRAKLDYDDIMWEVFDGEPGTKHCYKLMRRAAGSTEDEQGDINDGQIGFVVRDPSGGNRHLAVDAERAKAAPDFFPRTNTASEGVPQ